MQIKPIGNRVLVEIEVKPQQTASGIYISSKTEEVQYKGKIIALGTPNGDDGKILESLKTGQTVIISSYAGQEIKDETDDSKTLKIVAVKDIMAVVE